MKKIERKKRKIIKINGKNKKKEDVDRLYVNRKKGGRGLMKLEEEKEVEIKKLEEYVDRKEEKIIKVVRKKKKKKE